VKSIGVLGNLTRDRIGGRMRPGGGAYYAGVALRELARGSVILTKCAEADRAELLTPLVDLGMPVLWRESPTTTEFALVYDGDDRRLDIMTVGPEWTPAEARDWVRRGLADAEWLHVAALSRGDFPTETLAELARGRRLLLDGHGLLRAARPGPVELDQDFDRELLRYLAVLKLSEEEAKIVAGTIDETSLRSLGVPEVVVTLGPRGALVMADGALEHVPARRVGGDLDPTGAGDAFAAAYLVGRAAGYAPVDAARRAVGVIADLLSRRRG
jgi:1D-myo-inositol 3-kinase